MVHSHSFGFRLAPDTLAQDVVIVSSARTAIGSFRSKLASVSGTKLGTVALKAAIERAGMWSVFCVGGCNISPCAVLQVNWSCFSLVPAIPFHPMAQGFSNSLLGLTPKDIEEVYMGNVISAGMGQAPARQVVLGAGAKECGT
jgi:acetyl-CoA acetyltransferase